VEQVSCRFSRIQIKLIKELRPPFVKQISDGLDTQNIFTFFSKRVIKFSAFQ